MELDHKNIEAFKFLLLNYSKQALSTMKSLNISKERFSEFPDTKVLQLFQNISSLSITFCQFPLFPSKLIASVMPKLTKINLKGCKISSVKTLRPLGELKDLQELNLLNNPIIIDRISILNSLLFNGEINELCESKRKIKRAYTITRLILSKSKPATVPRLPPFQSLTNLNEEIITEDEIETIQPKNQTQPTVRYTDRVLSKVKANNEKILEDKKKYGSIKNISSSGNICFGQKKAKIDTFEILACEKKYKTPRFNYEDEEDVTEECSVLDNSELLMPFTVRKEEPAIPKDKINEFLISNRSVRENALKSIPKKMYSFHEVSLFMYGTIVHETSQVHAVCEVLSIVNGVKSYQGITENEIYNKLKYDGKNLSFEDIHEFQQILLLDDDMKNLRLKNAYFEWWLRKLEKRHIEFAEHQAILTVHKNRIFNNPLLGAQPPKINKKKKLVIKESQIYKKLINTSSRKHIMIEEEPKYVTVDFPSMFDPSEIKQGETIFIKPISKFENVLESLQSQMKEKERQYENLNLGEKVQWKLDKIKQNISDREAVREKLKYLYEQITKMKKKFIDNEVEYFYNIHEKKMNYHEILKKHDFLQFELPKFIFPLIDD